MADPFNVEQLNDREKKIIQGLVIEFKEMNDEERQEFIDILYHKGSDEVAQFFEKVQRVQNRSKEIDRLADKIIDRVS